MDAEEVRARLQRCGKLIAGEVGKETLFALLIFTEDKNGEARCEYISNGKREDVWRAVGEWVIKTSGKPLGDS